MHRLVGFVTSGLAIFLILIVGAYPVAAHANLVRSEPPANAILAESPSVIKLWFSEAPEVNFSQVLLYDRTGQQVQGVGSVTADSTDNKLLSVSVAPLPPGIYTVAWRTTSAVDGHVTSGGYAFVIGADQVSEGELQLPTVAVGTNTSGPDASDVILRWLGYLSMAFLIGGLAFTPVVLQPALSSVSTRASSPSAPPPDSQKPFSQASGLSRLIWFGWGLALAVTLLGAVMQAATSAGVNLIEAIGTPILSLVTGTRYGGVFLGRVFLLGLIGLLLLFRGSRRWRTAYTFRWWWAGVIVSVLIAFTSSLDSHAASQTDSLLPLLADWLHLTAVGLWAGGLVVLLLTLRWMRRVEGERFPIIAASLFSRFSQVATICISVIAMTGIYRAVTEVIDPANLIDTSYGTTLLIKMGALIPLLGLGAVNILFNERRIRQAIDAPDSTLLASRWYGLIRRTVLGEIAFVVLILLITGILTNLPPSQGTFGTGRMVRAQAEDLRIILVTNPGEPGFNTLTVYLKDELGRPVTDVQKVILRFSMIEHEMGTTEAVLTALGDGRYAITGSYVSMMGTWHIEAIIRRDGRDDTHSFLDVALRSPIIDSQLLLTYPLQAVLGIQVVIGGLLFLALMRRRSIAIAAIGGLLVSIIGAGMIVIALNNQAVLTQQNPILPESNSLRQGRMIYMSRCAPCHGLSGRGDGPAGNGLNPPPANLQYHMAPAAGHPDGQIFEWISKGFPNSAMPAFESTLSEEQRWDVINFIRTLADTQ